MTQRAIVGLVSSHRCVLHRRAHGHTVSPFHRGNCSEPCERVLLAVAHVMSSGACLSFHEKEVNEAKRGPFGAQLVRVEPCPCRGQAMLPTPGISGDGSRAPRSLPRKRNQQVKP